MSFIWIEMLWLLLIVPVLIAAYVLIQRRRQKYALRYASLSLVKEAIGRGPGIRRHIPPVLFLIAIAAMVFALARPVATVTLPSQKGTVILAVDVSGSMRADDLLPNRMEAAKSAARLFVEQQPRNVNIGVVAFSNFAVVVQAPTTDKKAVLASIDLLSPQRGTAIGHGILTSLDAVSSQTDAGTTSQSFGRFPSLEPTPDLGSASSEEFRSAIVVLLTDGESNVGPSPLEVVEEAAIRGVRIYTVGVGSPEGTVLRIQGRSIRVRLDEDTLERIAERTDASYFKADNETDLREIYQNLSTRFVLETKETELTAAATGIATVLLLIGSTLSLLWFNRLP